MRPLIPTIIFVYVLAASSGQNGHVKGPDHKAGRKQEETCTKSDCCCPPSPVLANVPVSTPIKTSTTEEHKDQPAEHHDDRPKITDWMMVGLTAAYVGVSVLLFLAVKRQANLAKTQADAALLSGQAAKDSVDAFISSQRSHLLIARLDATANMAAERCVPRGSPMWKLSADSERGRVGSGTRVRRYGIQTFWANTSGR